MIYNSVSFCFEQSSVAWQWKERLTWTFGMTGWKFFWQLPLYIYTSTLSWFIRLFMNEAFEVEKNSTLSFCFKTFLSLVEQFFYKNLQSNIFKYFLFHFFFTVFFIASILFFFLLLISVIFSASFFFLQWCVKTATSYLQLYMKLGEDFWTTEGMQRGADVLYTTNYSVYFHFYLSFFFLPSTNHELASTDVNLTNVFYNSLSVLSFYSSKTSFAHLLSFRHHLLPLHLLRLLLTSSFYPVFLSSPHPLPPLVVSPAILLQICAQHFCSAPCF